MMAQKEIAQCEAKNGHGTSRPLRKEKWPWYITPIAKRKWCYITPIAKRKMAIVHHAHCKTKNSPVMVHHAHCEMKNGHGTSRPLRKENGYSSTKREAKEKQN